MSTSAPTSFEPERPLIDCSCLRTSKSPRSRTVNRPELVNWDASISAACCARGSLSVGLSSARPYMVVSLIRPTAILRLKVDEFKGGGGAIGLATGALTAWGGVATVAHALTRAANNIATNILPHMRTVPH